LEKYIQNIKIWLSGLNAEQKRKIILICTAVFSALLTISVLISVIDFSENEKTDAPERLAVSSPIPAGEIFYPDEPDYIPGVILQRERRSSWTLQDASEYWQDPLKFGEEPWREIIEDAIDKLLEHVP